MKVEPVFFMDFINIKDNIALTILFKKAISTFYLNSNKLTCRIALSTVFYYGINPKIKDRLFSE